MSKFSTSQKTGVVSSARQNKKFKSLTLLKRKLCHNLDQKSQKLGTKTLPKLKLEGKIGSQVIKHKDVNSIKNYLESKSEAGCTSKVLLKLKLKSRILMLLKR